MHLLLCTTPDQVAYLKRFSTLAVFHGHRVSVMTSTPMTLSEISLKCTQAKVDGVMIANDWILKRTLNADPNFIEPTNKKQITLDDYAGSLLSIGKIPAVVLNPPEHIMTVPYGAYVFTRFIKKITAPDEWFPQTKFQWDVATETTIEDFYNLLASSRLIAIDIETPQPDDSTHTINCISFTGYFPNSHSSRTIVVPFTSLFFLTWIRKFCALPISKVLQGGTYDAVRLLRFACPISHYLFDTLNLFHSYYSELPKRLDFVSAFSLRSIRFWKDDGKTGNLEDYYRYNAMDGWATLNSLLALLLEIPDWAVKNYLIEFPLIFPCIHCEIEGWRVDPERFMVVKKEQQAIVADRLKKIRMMLKAPEYNPGSWQQNRKLFTVLGCADIGKVVDGKFQQSTNEAAMKKAEFRHPLNARIIGDIRDYKKAAKLVGTYCNETKLWRFSPDRWRLFYRLNPAGTDTGRLASSESSWWNGFQIQNIKRGPTIKQYLVADNGWRLAEPDFEQSESRCTFYLAGETKGIEVVESGKDFHCWNAQLFFGFKYEDLWDEKNKRCKTPEAKEIRDEPAKRTNHGANYNMSGGVMLDTVGPKVAARMKVLLKLPASMSLKDVCTHCLNTWSKTYPRVKGLYYDETLKSIELSKKLTSPLGWTRHFFGDARNNKHHLNALVAHAPQNLSVGIINRGFYKIWWSSIYGKFRGHVRLKAQIHDSIPFQYRDGFEWVVEEVRALMRQTIAVKGADGIVRNMTIPVSVAAGAYRWSELK